MPHFTGFLIRRRLVMAFVLLGVPLCALTLWSEREISRDRASQLGVEAQDMARIIVSRVSTDVAGIDAVVQRLSDEPSMRIVNPAVTRALRGVLESMPMPQGSVATIATSAGRVLASTDADPFVASSAGASRGSLGEPRRLRGRDGVERMYVQVPGGAGRWVVLVGLPTGRSYFGPSAARS